ncbi:Colicin-Ia [Yersinia mollaretii]|nr:Colicin-Ia [Yersinia mollaretii]
MAKALESVDRDLMAKNLAKFSKAFGIVGKTIDGVDIVKEFDKGLATGNWRPLLVKLETLAASKGAVSLVAFAFGVMTATPLGILGFSLLMPITSALINDELIEKINKYVLGI